METNWEPAAIGVAERGARSVHLVRTRSAQRAQMAVLPRTDLTTEPWQ